jgi:hypothetical protein
MNNFGDYGIMVVGTDGTGRSVPVKAHEAKGFPSRCRISVRHA